MAPETQLAPLSEVHSAICAMEGDVDTKRLCSLQVEDILEFGRLQNAKIGRLSAFENCAGIAVPTPTHCICWWTAPI